MPTEYDVALDQTPATESEDVARSEQQRVADMFRHVVGAVLVATDWNPIRVLVVLARLNGMSCAEIGARLGISKQAVSGHLKKTCRRNPALESVIKKRYKRREHVVISWSNVDRMRRAYEAIRRQRAWKIQN